MDSVPVPTADGHCRITIVVKQLGQRSPANFNRLLERLQRVCTLQVSDSPRRVIVANISTSVNSNVTAFTELQAHRRIIGFIGIVQAPFEEEQPSTSVQFNVCSAGTNNCQLQPCSSRRFSSAYATLSQIKEQYDMIKREHSATLVDSRCIAFGFDNRDFIDSWASREVLVFKSLEDSEKLENAVKDFFRSVFFVLESKRLDLSFEKLDPIPCPTLPVEQKYQMGLENKGTKLYRKKCLGRLKKQVADYTLLTGLPFAALDVFQAAIDNLKQANDYLWLAAAYEGWACAAMAVKYDFSGEYPSASGMQRVSTMTPDQMRLGYQKSQRTLGVAIGHQRYRSDVNYSSLLAPLQTELILSDEQQKRSFKLPWSFDKSRNGNALEHTEIFERFKLALENYERFSFAAYIEYECVLKAVSLLCLERRYIEMEFFLRDHIAKYLDDKFSFFDRYIKSMVCLHAALVFRSVGFNRKDAFFSRLACLFRLHVEGTPRTFADYRIVYPLFLRTLSAYGISDNARNLSISLTKSGPVQLQKKVLYEVFMSAFRAEHWDASIRHLCYLLQVYYEYMDSDYATRLFEELNRLVSNRPTTHYLNQHLTIPQCDIIVPPLQMTRFPQIQRFLVCPLPAHLSPTIVRPKPETAVFIYSPFQQNKSAQEATNWVVDCVCEVSVSVSNCLPFELSVHELSLLTEGCAFEAIPVELTLTSSENVNPVEIKLLGIPKAAGTISITGYRCEVFGIRSVCRLRDWHNALKITDEESGFPVFSVKVLPALPVLELRTSLPRAPITEENSEPAAEIAVYSGQTHVFFILLMQVQAFEMHNLAERTHKPAKKWTLSNSYMIKDFHFLPLLFYVISLSVFEHAIEIVNLSESIPIYDVCLEILQPKVSGGPTLIELIEEQTEAANCISTVNQSAVAVKYLGPKEHKNIKFRIFGIDPAAATEDESMNHYLNVHSKVEACRDVPDGGHDRIPFTGRLLMSDFVFRYRADVDRPFGEEYERCCRLPLAVTVKPAVTVAAWHVLPGEGPSSRYVVVDVTNSTEWDAELNYGGGKIISVQPKELCRVPLLCECCSMVSPVAFRLAASKASYVMQMQEMERLRLVLEKHVAVLLDIRWTISAVSLKGNVPVGPILSSVSLLKQLVVPALSVEIKVNGSACMNEEDIVVRIGEVVDIEVKLVSSINEERHLKGFLSLHCYRDLMNDSHFINSENSIRILNTETVPFRLCKASETRDSSADSISFGSELKDSQNKKSGSTGFFNGASSANFMILFLYEGTFKVKPLLYMDDQVNDFADDELFSSAVTFNVVTKVS